MFRIGLKFPCNGLNRVKKHGYSRLYLTARCYETRARVKCEPDGRLCKDLRLTSRLSGPKYSTDSSKSERSRGSGALLTLSAFTIGTIGILAYAKNNQEFRAALDGWIPGTDKTIQIIFQEESSYFDFIRSFFENRKQDAIGMIFGGAADEKPAPKPAFEPLVTKKETPAKESYTEIRVSKEKGEEIEVVADKTASPPKEVPEELTPKNLVQMETFCGELASKAIAEYQAAVCAIQEYKANVMKVIDGVEMFTGDTAWSSLQEATKKRVDAVKAAEKHANEALESLKKMYDLIDDPSLEAPAHMKTVARSNIRKILDDVDEAKGKYKTAVETGNVSEKYWKQVKTAREYFANELRVILPDVSTDMRVPLDLDTFAIFMMYAFNKVQNLQKQLEKQRTINEDKVKAALRSSGEEGIQEKLDALVCLAVDKERLEIEEECTKRLMKERKEHDAQLKKSMSFQAQAHADHLMHSLSAQQQAFQRIMNRAVKEQAQTDDLKYKSQLGPIAARLQGLESALKTRLEEEKDASNAQILWSACQALARAVKSSPPGAPVDKAVRPLEPEVAAVSKAAPKDDPLVLAVIRGIPKEAITRGVFPEDSLRERFLKVEDVARKLAMVPEQGASLPVYLLSYLQSFLIIKSASTIPRRELEDEPIDVKSLNTYDILQRARYWMDRGNFKMTLRYMNLLKGAPRSIARDWMNETRILLETQQAVDTLLAYAGATGLVFLGAGDSTKPQEK